MIARCTERMRQGACASCNNRKVCPAGRWPEAFAVPPDQSWFRGLLNLSALFKGLPARETKHGLKTDVEAEIELLVRTGAVSVDDVARQLGMSRQTLYRRLKAEGVTFAEILDAKRRQLAIRYMSNRTSVKAAAYMLAFSDPAGFSRAFKRWTGVSPSEFRSSQAN